MGVDDGHYVFEFYKQRMTTKDWREVLMNSHDRIIFHGTMRQLVAKKLGAGVVEVYKEPLKEDKPSKG